MNKNIHINLTIFYFSTWLTALLGIFLIQERVSLTNEQIHQKNILVLTNSPTEENLSRSIVVPQLSEEKLNLESQLLEDIDNSNSSDTSKEKTEPKTVTKSDSALPEKETLAETKITSKSINKSDSPVISNKTLELIREFEGFRSQAYPDSNGQPVIGYGLSKIAGKKVRIGDRISVHQAEAALKDQVHDIQEQIKSVVKVELNSHQLGALTSFAFNTGFYGLKNSTLLRKLNAGDHHGAANEFLRWNKAHSGGRLVPMAGLTRRRQAERQLFLTLPTP